MKTRTTKPDSCRIIHPGAVRRAFGGDAEHRAVPARIVALNAGQPVVLLGDSTHIQLAVDTERFADAITRPDVCRWPDGAPLVLVNFRYGLLGLAYGPATAPTRLAVVYGVVRFEYGSAVEIPGAAPQPGWLIFSCAIAGTKRADMARPEPLNPSTPTLFYRESHTGGLVFATSDSADENARIHEALRSSKTWREFRDRMPKHEYEHLMEATFDVNGERRPRLRDPFDISRLPSVMDGDYPEWLAQDMEHVLPEDVLRNFGKEEHSVLNGNFWLIPKARGTEVVAALEAHGFEVIYRPDLPFD